MYKVITIVITTIILYKIKKHRHLKNHVIVLNKRVDKVLNINTE